MKLFIWWKQALALEESPISSVRKNIYRIGWLSLLWLLDWLSWRVKRVLRQDLVNEDMPTMFRSYSLSQISFTWFCSGFFQLSVYSQYGRCCSKKFSHMVSFPAQSLKYVAFCTNPITWTNADQLTLLQLSTKFNKISQQYSLLFTIEYKSTARHSSSNNPINWLIIGEKMLNEVWQISWKENLLPSTIVLSNFIKKNSSVYCEGLFGLVLLVGQFCMYELTTVSYDFWGESLGDSFQMKLMQMLRYSPHEPLQSYSITIVLPANIAKTIYISCLDSNIANTLLITELLLLIIYCCNFFIHSLQFICCITTPTDVLMIYLVLALSCYYNLYTKISTSCCICCDCDLKISSSFAYCSNYSNCPFTSITNANGSYSFGFAHAFAVSKQCTSFKYSRKLLIPLCLECRQDTARQNSFCQGIKPYLSQL